jgi:hypothetical protein
MTDILDTLDEQQLLDLVACADGTLRGRRRDEVEAWIAASPGLQDVVRRQRLALAATRPLAEAPVPDSLEAATAGLAAPARAARRRRWTLLGSAAALAAVLVVFVVMSLGQGPAGPTVADAALLATLPATAAAPAPVAGTGRLDVAVEGLAFPDLATGHGWRAVGQRRDTIVGRGATVVYYAGGGKQVAYAIVASPVLATPEGATTTVRGGVEYQSFVSSGRSVVTWREDGHTCVLVGTLPAAELRQLAAWSSGTAGTY